MATDKGIARAFVLLRRAYPDHVGRHLSEPGAMQEQIDFYRRFFEDIPDELLELAVLDHISASQWWPKVSEIRERCSDMHMRGLGLPTAFEAWAQVKSNTRLAKASRTWHPLVKACIDMLGGMDAWGFSPVEDEPSWRAQFVRCYEAEVKRQHDDAAMLPQVRDQVARIAAARAVPRLAGDVDCE